MSDIDLNEEPKKKKRKFHNKFQAKFENLRPAYRRGRQKTKDFFSNPKKRLIFIASIGLIIVFLFGIGLYSLSYEKSVSEKKESETEEALAEALYPAVLDGVMTDQESANRHPLGIIVENHPDARPQSGLDKASVVYEAIAEGGITRFLALYGTYQAEKVGPVRSARTYYVDWAHGYNAFFAHVGGNMDALEKIPRDKILDLDQFRYASPYWREKEGKVASEHTMFTSTVKLREQASANKYSTANNFNAAKFKDEPKEDEKAGAPEKQTVSVVFSSAQFNVDFKYDKTTNSYKRLLAGSPHIDKISKDQINPKNIIVMTVKRKSTITKINEPGYDMTTVGSGDASIFIDGKTIKGTWKKPTAGDRELFYDELGNEIVFNRGQFWICVIPPEGSVAVQ